NTERNRWNGADVCGDILAEHAITARRADRETPILISQRHCEAVELEFGYEGRLQVGTKPLLQPAPAALVPGADFILAERVRQRQHRGGMAHLLETLEDLATDPLRRRLRRDELCMRSLEVLEPAE